MQTFFPLESLFETAECLDYRRLGKQRVECLQILKAIKTGSGGWSNHPAVKMWKGYTASLVYYASIMCFEWCTRGYEENVFKELIREFPVECNCIYLQTMNIYAIEKPPFVGDTEFHDSHKSNLLRKNPAFYGKYNWNVEPNLPYIWPVTERSDMSYQDSLGLLVGILNEKGIGVHATC